MGKRKDKTRSCEKCRHLERGIHVPDGEFLTDKRLRWSGRVQRRDKDEATRKILQMTVPRWKAKSRQTKVEVARPGEKGYGQKPDDD